MTNDDNTDCPFITRCPMFPEFKSQGALGMFIVHYCKSDFGACERYKRASAGTMPPSTMLPDGSSLER